MASTMADKSIQEKSLNTAKKVGFYRNGDTNSKPFRVCINSKDDFEALKERICKRVNSDRNKPFSRCDRIVTPKYGRREILNIQDFEHDENYVVTGKERFKRTSYNDNLKPWSHGTPRQVVTDHAEFSNKYTNVSSKYQEVSKYHRMRIRVRPFNKPEENPKPAVIDFSKSFETNLMKINQDRKVVNHCLRERETFRLVTSIEELNKDADYILIHANDSQRRRPRTLPTIDTKMKNASPNSVASDPQTRKREARRERPGGIHSRQVKHHHSQDRNGQTDKDNGVFKPKSQNQHTKGAKEIVDTKDTRVDLPIDQVQAEEVEEEEIVQVEETIITIPSQVTLSRDPSDPSNENNADTNQKHISFDVGAREKKDENFVIEREEERIRNDGQHTDRQPAKENP